jgi:hypothetical protein
MKQTVTRLVFLSLMLVALGATPALGQVIYDSTVTPLPGNLPSVGAEAYAFNQFGDGVTFAGTSRRLANVTVTLSSWACQSGNWYSGNCVSAPGATYSLPITFNIYNAGSPLPGSPIATVTQNFAVPYRPSASAICGDGRWYDSSSATCFNGKAANITFDFSSLNVTLPNSVVYGIVYNTSHYGPNPIGDTMPCNSTTAGCFYDSLNIALAPVVTVGTKPFFNTVYQNSAIAAEYCDNGLDGTGTFRLDSASNACWVGEIPAARFNAATVPANSGACKNGGWQTLTRADGSSFKNQGDCVSYTNNGK